MIRVAVVKQRSPATTLELYFLFVFVGAITIDTHLQCKDRYSQLFMHKNNVYKKKKKEFQTLNTLTVHLFIYYFNGYFYLLRRWFGMQEKNALPWSGSMDGNGIFSSLPFALHYTVECSFVIFIDIDLP